MTKRCTMKNVYKIEGATTKVWSTGKNSNIFFTIDTANLDKIKAVTWRVYVLKNGYYKVESGIFRNGKKQTFVLSRFLTDAKPKINVDHVDRNPLNNTIENLRFASHSENGQNVCKRSKRATSIFKGVCFHKQKNKWFAYINCNKKRYSLGYFDNESDAAIAYNNKAKELFPEFSFENKVV